MLRNDVISRVGGEGRGWDGIWVSRVNHSPRTSTAYIYLYAFVFVTLAFGRIAARISPRRSFIFTPRFAISRSRYKNFEPRRTKLVHTSFLPSREDNFSFIDPGIAMLHPKCWKHRDLCIIATPVSRSNQPILNSPKGRKKERKRKKETRRE